MSSHNSNDDMEVIGPEDLEDSPPPGDNSKDEDNDSAQGDDIEDSPPVEIKADLKSEEVKSVAATGDTEQIGEIVDVDEKNTSVNSIDDDPPIEILDAPTPPIANEHAAVATEPEAVNVPEVVPVAVAPEVPAVEAAVPEVVPPVAAAPEVVPLTAAVPEVAPAVAAPEPAPAAPAPRPQVVAVRPTVTAERPAATLEEVDDEEDDDDIDETLAERLVGLTEMFPDFVRNGSVSLVKGSWSLTQSCYSLARAASWVVFSSATILFMPVMIESERLQLQDQQKAQKNQILLGPGAAVSGGPSLGPPPI